MSSIAATSTEVPPAFLCAQSKKVMDNPLLAMCGHLFDKAVLADQTTCPVDNKPIGRVIVQEELKQRIAAFKAREVTRPTMDYAGATSSSSVAPITERMKRVTVSGPRPEKYVANAHMDDIHGFSLLRNGNFVSGSKDTTIKIWSPDCELEKQIDSSAKGYKYWITALRTFSNGYFATGTRDGILSMWRASGSLINEFSYTPSSSVRGSTAAKDRNKTRINCITECETRDDTTTFYTGTPRFVQQWCARSGRMLWHHEAHKNDWVYCIEQLSNYDLLVVIGSSLEYWDMSDDEPQKQAIVTENLAERNGRFRPHISALTKLDESDDLFAGAFFDGSVRMINIAKNEITARHSEHQTSDPKKSRVWSVINLAPNIIASSADDKTVKIWDIRTGQAHKTISGFPGRVSSLLKLSSEAFVAGSCPDDVFQSHNKAQITKWDLRKLIPA